MVNIQSLSQIILDDAAILACEIVALAGFAALVFPIRSIIGRPSSFPIGMIVPRYIFGLPFPHAIRGTEISFSFTNFTLDSENDFATGGTLDFDIAPLPIRGSFCHEIFGVPLSSAFDVAKKMFGFLDFTRKAFDCLSAIIAKAIDFLAPAAVLRGFFTFPVFFSPLSETNSIAKMILLVFESSRTSTFYLFIAIVTIIKSSFLSEIFRLPFINTFPATEFSLISQRKFGFEFFLAIFTLECDHFSIQKGVTPNISGSVATENRARGDKNGLNKNPLYDFPWPLNYSIKRDYCD